MARDRKKEKTICMARERKRRRRARLKREAKRIQTRCGSTTTTCITDLPICIMEFIVSLLPLKDARNIILVSPQCWRHLSDLILTRRNIKVSQFIWGRRIPCGSKKEKQLATVRRLDAYLKQYKGDKVDSFIIDANVVDSRIKLYEWVSWAIKKGVEELHVRNHWNPIDFPHRLLVGLRHLRMTKYNPTNLGPGFDGFHRLTTLSVYDANLDQFLLKNLFSFCPVLESLTLKQCQILGRESRLRIVAGDRLNELKLLKSYMLPGVRCLVDITALNLVTLEFDTDLWKSTSFSMTTPQLARMYFQYLTWLDSGDEVSPLAQFASCAGLETLHLQMKSDMLRLTIAPTFANLKQLRVDLEQHILDKCFRHNNDVIFVVDLLEAAPGLEDLVISFHIIKYFPVVKSELVPQQRMNITNDNLKTVKMYGFQGNWYETKLAVHILETSPKLERLVIDTDDVVRIYAGDGKFKRLSPDDPDEPKNDGRATIAVAQEKLNDVKSDAHIIFL